MVYFIHSERPGSFYDLSCVKYTNSQIFFTNEQLRHAFGEELGAALYHSPKYIFFTECIIIHILFQTGPIKFYNQIYRFQ